MLDVGGPQLSRNRWANKYKVIKPDNYHQKKEIEMNKSRIITIIVAVLFLSFSTSCNFGPPPSCGENIGGVANNEVFSTYFSDMVLIDQSTGQTGTSGENGLEFQKSSKLGIQYEAISEVTLRACIQPMGGSSTIAFDQSKALSTGQGQFELDAFESGNYVIRVIVGDTLIKNFPFTMK